MRRLPLKWLNDLKLAIINQEINNIGELMKNIPSIEEMDEATEALALINEAIAIVEKERERTLKTMNKIKQTKAFLKSS